MRSVSGKQDNANHIYTTTATAGTASSHHGTITSLLPADFSAATALGEVAACWRILLFCRRLLIALIASVLI